MSTSEQLTQAPEATTTSASCPLGLSDFRFLSIVGKGSYGKVWFAHAMKSNTACAVKAIKRDPRRHPRNDDGKTDFQREVDCMKRVDPRFPFVVQFLGHFTTSQYDFLVMEYLGCEDMFDHLGRHAPLPESRAKLYIAELGCALQHLHDHNIIYRDLKIENIVLAPDGHLKLIDFGLSKVLTAKTTDSMAGTIYSMAPEILMNQAYDCRVDWYSLGVVCYEMFVGEPPFYKDYSNKFVFQQMVIQATIPTPFHLSRDCRDLLERLLEKDPSSRLVGFHDLLNHRWFTGYSPRKVLLKLYKPKYVPNSCKRPSLSKFSPDFNHPDAKEYYSLSDGDSLPPAAVPPSSVPKEEDSPLAIPPQNVNPLGCW